MPLSRAGLQEASQHKGSIAEQPSSGNVLARVLGHDLGQITPKRETFEVLLEFLRPTHFNHSLHKLLLVVAHHALAMKKTPANNARRPLVHLWPEIVAAKLNRRTAPWPCLQIEAAASRHLFWRSVVAAAFRVDDGVAQVRQANLMAIQTRAAWIRSQQDVRWLHICVYDAASMQARYSREQSCQHIAT